MELRTAMTVAQLMQTRLHLASAVAVLQIPIATEMELRTAMTVAQLMQTRLHLASAVAVLQIPIATEIRLSIATTTALLSLIQAKLIAMATGLVTHAISHRARHSIAIKTTFQILATSRQAQALTSTATEYQTSARMIATEIRSQTLMKSLKVWNLIAISTES